MFTKKVNSSKRSIKKRSEVLLKVFDNVYNNYIFDLFTINICIGKDISPQQELFMSFCFVTVVFVVI